MTSETRDTVFDASRFSGLYQQILKAPSNTCAKIGQPSGFQDPEIADYVAGFDWRPVGQYPRSLVCDESSQNIRLYQVSPDGILVGIRAGGGIAKGQQFAQAGTEHSLNFVINGHYDIELVFRYNGLDGWQYKKLALPSELIAKPIHGCEVEKDGRLLYSGVLGGDNDVQAAERANLVRFFSNGQIEGWATSSQTLCDVFLNVIVDGQAHILPTDKQWGKTELRRFRQDFVPSARTLYFFEVETLQGVPAARSPAWGFVDDKCGFLLSNPRCVGDDVLITVVPEDKEKYPVKALESLVDGVQFPLIEKDAESHRYYNGVNTVRVPVQLLQETSTFKILGDGQQVLGVMPPLAPILARMS